MTDQMTIRPFQPDDTATVKALTIEGFNGVSIESLIERRWPGSSALDWGERKFREVEMDLTVRANGCFVAELDGEVVGFITTAADPVKRQGHIRDLVVDRERRGHGIGRRLLEHALAEFRRRDLTIARIETLSHNAIGAHLYPDVGFRLMATQNHYAMPLARPTSTGARVETAEDTRADPGSVRSALLRGVVIPAHPLALDKDRRLDERRQRALTRYYLEAGAGGIAVGVHTTQFAIHDAKVGLYAPVLSLAAETARERQGGTEPVLIAGIVGPTEQALREAALAVDLGYHAGLLSLGALATASEDELLRHCAEVAKVIPLVGFYLQPAVGGRRLPYSFWRRFLEIEDVWAIKVAPFNRYQTLDVVRAVAESGRAGEVALYTGNDDHIVEDLLASYRFPSKDKGGETVETRFVGGLLGQWAVWTKRAVELLDQAHQAAIDDTPRHELRSRASELTDANAAIFDAANGFAGCIPGIHEVLRRQGLVQGCWCIDPNERLSPGQAEEIDRVCRAYPHLADDAFVAERLDSWLR